jgi:hypothetical protein
MGERPLGPYLRRDRGGFSQPGKGQQKQYDKAAKQNGACKAQHC